jgi:uncharacterized protein YgiM (DUF1202 family)
MSNSSLVNYTRISPNSSNPRKDSIRKITIHHMSGNLSVETCGEVFAPESRQASSNYGIGSDGRVGMYVEEKNRAWTSSSGANDHQAVTIEVANSHCGGDWPVSDAAYEKLIQLCVDICQRNGIGRLNFTGDANGNLTMHKYFANTDCPGPYLEARFPAIAAEVNRRLGASGDSTPTGTTSPDYGMAIVNANGGLNVRSGPGTDYTRLGGVANGATVRIGSVSGNWANIYWGDHGGWVCMDYLNVTEVFKKPAPAKPTTPAAGNGFRVVVQSFTNRAYAEDLQKQLKAKGFDSFLLPFSNGGVNFLRVIAGSYKERSNANEQQTKLKAAGFDSFLAAY